MPPKIRNPPWSNPRRVLFCLRLWYQQLTRKLVMAFEKGHKHSPGPKPKLFDAALKRAIAQDNGERIRACAEKLLDLAASGEPWAIKELADRLDGKAQQHVSVERKNVEDLSLADLAAEMASAIAAGGQDQAAGAGELGSVH